MVISSAPYPHQGAAGCSLWRLMTRTMLLGKFEDAIMSITCSLGTWRAGHGEILQDTVSGKGKRSPSYSILKIPHRRSTSTYFNPLSFTQFPHLHDQFPLTPSLAAGHRVAQQTVKLQETILDVIRLGFLVHCFIWWFPILI